MSPSVSHLSLWETAKSELRNALPRADLARALGLTYDQLRHCIRKHSLMEGQD